MPTPVFKVDAFTNRPFAGNPAAVCLLSSPKDDEWMRLVAREMAVSETAFLWASDPANHENASTPFRLRWFTPETEVDLCGHGTLATAHVLWETGRLPATECARFQTRSGILTARHHGDWISLDLPALAVEDAPVPPPVVEALGVEPIFTGKSGARYFLEVGSEDVVRRLVPDFGRLRSIPGRAVIVTAAADSGSCVDFVSRYFAPWVGVNEDPVTGSAHCALGPFWGARLGKTQMLAWQASPRGGQVRVTLAGNRVSIGGQAVTVLAGELSAHAGA